METFLQIVNETKHDARSQPTYKGWKLNKLLDRLYATFVPSLPTRDGNMHGEKQRVYVRIAGSQPTYKGWKPRWPSRDPGPESSVPSLPTRDGNIRFSIFSAVGAPVPSLPTRDGNPLISGRCSLPCTGSQPTYKGWKLKGS